MSIQVVVDCFLDPKGGLMKRGEAIEEWRHVTEIKEKLFLEPGQKLKDLYQRIAERNPLLRSVVEGGRFVGVRIYSYGAEIPRYELSLVYKIPEAA
jgi:hypothetical protein